MSVREITAANGAIDPYIIGFTCLQQGVITFNGGGGNAVSVACAGYDTTNCTVSYESVSNALLVPTTDVAASVSGTSFVAKGAATQSGTAYYQVWQALSTVPTVNAS